MTWTWHLLRAGREVGTVVLHDDGRVEARWPKGFPNRRRREIEEGRACFRELGWSDEPRPELAASPEYWHWVLAMASGDKWDNVESNYEPPEYPIVDEHGNPIVY